MDGYAGGALLHDAQDDAHIAATVSTSVRQGGSSLAHDLMELPARFGRIQQQTLRNPIHCTGVGLHSGRVVTLWLRPAAPNSGILFRRTDLGIDIPARHDTVIDTRLCTMIGVRDAEGRVIAQVGTIEHLMAALAACGIDNAVVELDGAEVPVMDGSSAPFTFLIACAGRIEQASPRVTIEVLKRVRVEEKGAFAELRPGQSAGLHLSLSIDFAAEAIGRQSYSMALTEHGFESALAQCRTFTMLQEIEQMRAAGLARGGSLDNAVVVDGAAVLNPTGLRCTDEFVRHKMLDAVGDLSLAGNALRGRFIGHRSGHGLNNRLLHALFADSSAWRFSGRTTARAETMLGQAA